MSAITFRSTTFRSTIVLPILLALSAASCIQADSLPARMKRLTEAELITGIIDDNYHSDSLLNLLWEPSPQFARYAEIRDRSPFPRLLQLWQHPAPLMRAYAFQAIAERDRNVAMQILLKAADDTARFEDPIGCSGMENTVFFFCLGQFNYNRYKGWRGVLSEDERVKIDSVLVFSQSMTDYVRDTETQFDVDEMRTALLNIYPLPQFHSRISRLAASGNPNANAALAKYSDPVSRTSVRQFLLTRPPDNYSDMEMVMNATGDTATKRLCRLYIDRLLDEREQNRSDVDKVTQHNSRIEWCSIIHAEKIYYIFALPHSLLSEQHNTEEIVYQFHDRRMAFEGHEVKKGETRVPRAKIDQAWVEHIYSGMCYIHSIPKHY